MALRNSKPLTLRPAGVSDAIDGTNAFPGAMSTLANLIPSPSDRGILVPRPASVQVTDFTGYTNPAYGSALLVIGNLAYGMIGSDDYAGKDTPFIYDLQAAAFVAITGITAPKLPTTQLATGDWNPPHMEIVGHYVVITHPGYDGVTYFFGWIDISNPAAPAYDAGNTATHALPSVPRWVSQYNGRAWFAVDNTEWFTDSLDPLTITNATQVLKFDDNTPVTCSIGLPLQNSLVGGVVQSLIVVKGAEVMYQVTGDQATTNLQKNTLNVSIGTLAPNSMAPTPLGIAFIAPDGLRIIDFQANISEPIGANGEGVSQAFLQAQYPSRIAGAFNQNTYRVSVANQNAAGVPTQEYWFNFKLKSWYGPHSFPAGLIAPCYYNNTGFILFATGVTGKLFSSTTIPTSASVYTENGTALAWAYGTVLLPDNQEMRMNSMVESTLAMKLPANQQITVQCINEDSLVLDTVYLSAPPSSAAVWGGFDWGAASWGSAMGYFQQYQLPWSQPLVFKQMGLLITGSSLAGFAIGNLYLKYQVLGYLLNVQLMTVQPIAAAQAITTESGVELVTEDGDTLVTEGEAG